MTSRVRLSTSPLCFAVTDEVAQPADDLPRPHGLTGSIVQRLAGHRQRLFVGCGGQQIAKAFAVVCDGGERLVELMCQARRQACPSR